MSPCPLSPLPDPPPRFRPHDPRGRALAVFPKSPPEWGESARGSTRVWNPREPRPCPEPLRALGAGTGGGVSAATAPYLARALPAATFQSSQRGWGGGDGIGGSDQGACATPGPAHPSTPSYRKPPPLLTTTRYAYPVTRNPGCNQEKLPSKSLSKQEQTWLDRPLTRLDAPPPSSALPGQARTRVLLSEILAFLVLAQTRTHPFPITSPSAQLQIPRSVAVAGRAPLQKPELAAALGPGAGSPGLDTLWTPGRVVLLRPRWPGARPPRLERGLDRCWEPSV
ncbi:hypothetical protein H8957_001246, partial [Semnopithecus entellus]